MHAWSNLNKPNHSLCYVKFNWNVTRTLFKDDTNLITKPNLKLITILVNLKFQHKSPIFMQI